MTKTKQQACSYCHEPYKKLLETEDYFDERILVTSKGSYLRITNYYDYTGFTEINYCPKCGRKLGDGNVSK